MAYPLKNKFWAAGLLMLAVLGLGAAPLRAVTFTATFDRDTIALGETATLSLTFEGGQPQTVPSPDVPGLQIVNAGNAQNFSIVNGQMHSTVTITFSVNPKRTGGFIIPAMTVDVNGQSFTSQPLKLTVVPPNSPPPQAVSSGSEVAFMRLALAKTNVWVGEVTTANIRIYLRDDVQDRSQPQFTSLPADGFSVGKGVYQNAYREQIGSRAYTVIPLSVALTATRTGPVNVGPVAGSLVIVLPSSNQGGDPFFRQFFNAGEQKQVSLATEAVLANSLPLPAENIPPNFNGAVGSYTLNVTAGPTNVTVGDPITVRIQISGRGALNGLTLPDQPAWHDFKMYPPTSRLETSDSLGLQGTKTFEQIVTPQNTDVRELPAFAFSFFDPDAGTYRTLTEPALPLAIHSGGPTPMPVIAAAKTANLQTPPPQADLLPIKEQPGTPVQSTPPLLVQPAFLATQTLPVLAWLATVVWRRRTDNLANNPRLRRQRQVARLVRDGLADLRRLAAENNSDEFFVTLFRLLQEQLGERLDCPASSITEAAIDERLALFGVPETTLAGLRELFHLCNQARYAPLQTSGELAAVIPPFENVIQALQTMKA